MKSFLETLRVCIYKNLLFINNKKYYLFKSNDDDDFKFYRINKTIHVWKAQVQY